MISVFVGGSGGGSGDGAVRVGGGDGMTSLTHAQCMPCQPFTFTHTYSTTVHVTVQVALTEA